MLVATDTAPENRYWIWVIPLIIIIILVGLLYVFRKPISAYFNQSNPPTSSNGPIIPPVSNDHSNKPEQIPQLPAPQNSHDEVKRHSAPIVIKSNPATNLPSSGPNGLPYIMISLVGTVLMSTKMSKRA